MFEAIGTVSVVMKKKCMLSQVFLGSGPAYVYYLVEAMEKAAKEEGLPEEVAKQLISQTIIGAGYMLKHATEPTICLKRKRNKSKWNNCCRTSYIK